MIGSFIKLGLATLYAAGALYLIKKSESNNKNKNIENDVDNNELETKDDSKADNNS